MLDSNQANQAAPDAPMQNRILSSIRQRPSDVPTQNSNHVDDEKTTPAQSLLKWNTDQNNDQ